LQFVNQLLLPLNGKSRFLIFPNYYRCLGKLETSLAARTHSFLLGKIDRFGKFQ